MEVMILSNHFLAFFPNANQQHFGYHSQIKLEKSIELEFNSLLVFGIESCVT